MADYEDANVESKTVKGSRSFDNKAIASRAGAKSKRRPAAQKKISDVLTDYITGKANQNFEHDWKLADKETRLRVALDYTLAIRKP